jgi:hypothetical protein
MNSTSLFAEFIVIGLVPFLALVFFALSAFHIYTIDISKLSPISGFSALLAVVFTAVVYFLGALLHRLSQLFSLAADWWQARRTLDQAPDEDKKKRVYLYQLGSDRLIQVIEYEKSLERIFSSLAISLPFLGIALYIWLGAAAGAGPAQAVLIMCLVLAVLSAFAFWLQRRNRYHLQDAFLKLKGYTSDTRL